MYSKQEIKFSKYQGLGNDFVFFNKKDVDGYNYPKLAQRVCNRHFGIGADGMAVLSKASDIKMEFYNSDGSKAPMCGNASRCVVHYAIEQGLTIKKEFILQTAGGDLKMKYSSNNLITANLGQPLLKPSLVPATYQGDSMIDIPITVNNQVFKITVLNTMTPHCVIFVDDLSKIDIAEVGSSIENHSMFPKKINTNFVQIINRNKVKQITWERGAGQTLACGTGACATVVAGVLSKRLNNEVEVIMDGGTLTITYDKKQGIQMTGKVEKIASGVYYYNG